jgi:hypothetical protein
MVGDSNGSNSSYGPVLNSYIWMAYRQTYCDLYMAATFSGDRSPGHRLTRPPLASSLLRVLYN